MAKVHLLCIPDSTFSEIITRHDLEFLNNLTSLYFWNHFSGYKLIIREEVPINLLAQLEIHQLDYQYDIVSVTF
jgi:hypothetical protein